MPRSALSGRVSRPCRQNWRFGQTSRDTEGERRRVGKTGGGGTVPEGQGRGRVAVDGETKALAVDTARAPLLGFSAPSTGKAGRASPLNLASLVHCSGSAPPRPAKPAEPPRSTSLRSCTALVQHPLDRQSRPSLARSTSLRSQIVRSPYPMATGRQGGWRRATRDRRREK